jgi:hypothetical protein
MAKTTAKPKAKPKHTIPATKAGKAAVKRLGRNYKTGNFAKGVADIMASGKSKDVAEKIMGAQYWREVAKVQGKKKPAKGPAKKRGK